MQSWKRRIKEGGAQQKKKKKSWFRLLNEMIFPCDGEELARVKPVKMVSQEKIVTANTRI